MPPSEPPASVVLPAAGIGAAAGMSEVAVETPVNIVYGTMPYAVMLASPADLEDFVHGFSFTEGIVTDVAEILGLELRPEAEGIIAEVRLAPGRFRAHLARRRNLTGRTSCGLCGIEALDELPRAASVPAARAPVTPRAIRAALAGLAAWQPLHRLTRAVHAAAWCDADGAILAVREDVGRHNALDKLIGALLRGGSSREGFVVVTSRASFEMVEKAAIFGAGTLVALSAPTSLAVERAQRLGVTLVAGTAGGSAVFAGSLAAASPAETP